MRRGVARTPSFLNAGPRLAAASGTVYAARRRDVTLAKECDDDVVRDIHQWGGGLDELRTLVERARESDPDAWEKLYVRSYPRLYGYARRRVLSHEEAADAVSEAFTRAYAGIERFKWRGGGFDAWMYRILRNVLLETHRRGLRRSVSWFELAGEEPNPMDHVLANEEGAALRAAFARLAPEDREILELRVVWGLDASEVARIVRKRAGAVRMAQSRALARLRALMLESEHG